jgi:HNH endonuclease/NUMOD4 motif
MNHQEIWKDINGYEGRYKISNFGRVWSVRNKVLLSPYVTKSYLCVSFIASGKKKNYKVHRLVAIHFIDNPKEKTEVNHIDGDKLNNHYKNLEWCTRSENMKHAHSSGLIDHKGENSPASKITEKQVRE